MSRRNRAFSARDIREEPSILNSALKEVMAHAAQAAADSNSNVRIHAYLRFGLAIAVSTAGAFLIDSLQLSLLLTVVAIGLSILLTVNHWGSLLYLMALYHADQAVAVHENHIGALADVMENAVEHLEGESSDDLLDLDDD